jgi:hypothetical protein
MNGYLNFLQHKAYDNLLTIFFHVGLVTITGMKIDTLFDHKETIVIYKKKVWAMQMITKNC